MSESSDRHFQNILLPSLEATRRFAANLASQIVPPMTLALDGTLGAGKTQLVRFLTEALGATGVVNSPTYVLHHRYMGSFPIHHFDFYRLDHAEQAWDLGIDELYEQPVIVVIEWAHKFPVCLPEDRLNLKLSLTAGEPTEESRKLEITPTGPTSQSLCERLGLG